jgi:CPA2 family monovalent cation:H+ antiporter-2
MNTPGFVADMELSGNWLKLSHSAHVRVGPFFPDDPLAVRRIAVPGALVQIAVATAFGAAIAFSWDEWGASCLASRSTASTVVLFQP